MLYKKYILPFDLKDVDIPDIRIPEVFNIVFRWFVKPSRDYIDVILRREKILKKVKGSVSHIIDIPIFNNADEKIDVEIYIDGEKINLMEDLK